MKILVAPDKFKGSLTAKEVCESVKVGIQDVFPDAEVYSLPLADGGEGTLEILVEALGLQRVDMTVNDPLFRPVNASYAIDGSNAYIEMALASGLQLLSPQERSAMKTSSVGVGELIHDAVLKGTTTIFLFVGGSATNDGGIGMASALGFKFLDKEGHELQPTGENLSNIQAIEKYSKVRDFEVHLITDVQNPLLGSNGAAKQYAKQKGATPEEIDKLEEGLRHFSKLVAEHTGKEIAAINGSGAAGGMAVSAIGLMNGSIQQGMKTILEIVNLKKILGEVDLVITGEGKVDEQTLQGKVVHGVANAAKEFDLPVYVICGNSELSIEELNHLSIDRLAKIKTAEISVERAMRNASDLLRQRVSELLRED